MSYSHIHQLSLKNNTTTFGFVNGFLDPQWAYHSGKILRLHLISA